MEFKSIKCPICGSEMIKEYAEYEKDGDIFYGYQCNSCYCDFNSEAEKRLLNLKKSLKEKKVGAKVVTTPTNEVEKEDITVNAFERNRDSIVSIISVFGEETHVGSGFVIDGGYVVTNSHVIANLTEDGKISNISSLIFCKFYKALERYELEFVYADPKVDLAILKIDKENLKPVKFALNNAKTGEKIYAIGNSMGRGLCILDGIVADECRVVEGIERMAISANIMSGNSGGPIVNEKGELVGVAVASSSDQINYAIPMGQLSTFLEKVKEEIFDCEEC